MWRAPCVLVLCSLPLLGCAAGSGPGQCTSSLLLGAHSASGAVTSPDHTAATPGNQEQFVASATYTVTGTGCAVPALGYLVKAAWTTSDAVDVQISSANDDTNGLATCVGATLAPATLTATAVLDGNTETATATIVCK